MIDGALAALRLRGWAVAVHNDYRLGGEPHTFWLFTKGDLAARGEGRSDEEALEIVQREALRVEGAASSGREEVERLRAALNVDATGLAHALDEVVRLADGFSWIARGESGAHDDAVEDRATWLQEEIGRALSSIREAALAALRGSGDLATRVLGSGPLFRHERSKPLPTIHLLCIISCMRGTFHDDGATGLAVLRLCDELERRLEADDGKTVARVRAAWGR